VRHGKEGESGFLGERVVKIVRKGRGKEEWQVRYHLTDPVKISMLEKTELNDRFVDMVDTEKETMGGRVKVMYVSMLPRFVGECYKGHMTDEYVWLLDGLRRDVDNCGQVDRHGGGDHELVDISGGETGTETD
jgi:hypothetical protein